MGSPLAILKSDSTVGKFVFIILLVIIFIYTLRLVSSLISHLFGPDTSPMLVKGMRRATKGLIIEQDPKISGSKTIMRSENEEGGVEFTWTVWIFVENLDLGNQSIRHVFHKGNAALSDTGIFKPNNTPGLYIDTLKPSVDDKGMQTCNMFVHVLYMSIITSVLYNSFQRRTLLAFGKNCIMDLNKLDCEQINKKPDVFEVTSVNKKTNVKTLKILGLNCECIQ